MKSFSSFFCAALLSANNIEVVPFDWGGQFGYLNQGGAIFWNSDWRSNNLLFDGTWTAYPRMFGPEIEKGFKPKNLEIVTETDSVGIISNFQYDQGDYLLDRFGLTLVYGLKKRNTKFHGFKRTYAGGNNQYSNGSLQPQQQSYIFNYKSVKDRDDGGISLGHFNTNSGYPDSLDGSLIDNRITASNLFWNRGGNKANIKFSIDYFLQRYKTNHSLALTNKARYLTRQQYQLEVDFQLFKYDAVLLLGKNVRGVKTEDLRSTEWEDLLFQFGKDQIKISTGIFHFENENFIKRSLDIGKTFGLANLNLHYNLDYKPNHPYFKSQFPDLLRNYSIIETITGLITVNLKNDKISAMVSSINDKSELMNQINEDSLNNESSFNRINITYQTNSIPFFDTEINYVIQEPMGIYSGSLGNWFGLKLKSNFKLFDGFMKIGIDGELKHLQSRTSRTYFNFIEMVPQNRRNKNFYQPINIINAKITAQVSRLIIAYEWYNIEELMLGLLNPDENNYFKIQSDMPALGRQVNLTISWAFKD